MYGLVAGPLRSGEFETSQSATIRQRPRTRLVLLPRNATGKDILRVLLGNHVRPGFLSDPVEIGDRFGVARTPQVHVGGHNPAIARRRFRRSFLLSAPLHGSLPPRNRPQRNRMYANGIASLHVLSVGLAWVCDL